jgi:hypothetical protein
MCKELGKNIEGSGRGQTHGTTPESSDLTK